MKKNSVKKVLAVALCSALVLAATGCNKQPKTEVEVNSAVVVRAVTPEIANMQQTAAFTGRVMPDDYVAVIGKSSGTVLKTYFNVGDTVKKGDLLFEIDPQDYAIGFEQAKIAYEKALNDIATAESGSGDALLELQYQTAITNAGNAYEAARASLEAVTDDDFSMTKFKQLRKAMKDAEKAYMDGTGSYQDYVTAEQNYNIGFRYNSQYTQVYVAFESAYSNYEAALEQYEIYKNSIKNENTTTFDLTRQQAKLQYDSMLQTMGNLKVTAPIDGIIEQKNVSENSMYGSSGPAYIVSNKNLFVVNFAVSSSIATGMNIGDEVVIENGKDVFSAQVSEIGTMVDATSGLFPIKATINNNQASLLSGVSVKLTAITAKSNDCLTIPLAAVYYDNGSSYVYIVEDGMAKKTPVELGIIADEIAEVLSGVTTSDSVITTWSPNLLDGVAVEISQEV